MNSKEHITEHFPVNETDNVIIVESGQEAKRKKEIHELLLQEIADVRAQRDLYANQLSQAKRMELVNANKFETMKKHFYEMLDEVEATHAENGKLSSWQSAYNYCAAARVARQLGRKGDIEGIVSEQMKTM